ncbi:alpha/beta hydrolase [Clostridium sp. SHJSY1]|uniref:alpha/beta hydrolase n=1 Tax=Clostridium sp. SHJSY1 TaxID=2942483 RepID=UPI002875BA48|nr:alpha/beta hydrolase [Clostridium sp. SHJSY1]MDS0524290.1 alpha/beta hydrolase [Clostridium sp. SHJSY1]
MDLNDPKIFRKFCSKGDAKRDEGLTTPDDIKRYDNISYGIHGELNLLDIYHKKNVADCQQTIISIHGGGWVYGNKDVYQFYCMDLAQRGFTVVNFSYRLAPEAPFPAALEDVNRVFIWIAEHAKEYNIDLNNLFIVGDSAGAQLASQYMAMLTNYEFQKFYNFKVPSDKIKVKAGALNCGIYDLKKYVETSNDSFILAYLEEDAKGKLKYLDTMKYITKEFPPVFVSTAHNDFLKEHARPMYDKLKKLGVPCKYKIYGNKDNAKIAHVFHLDIRMPEAKECNDEECEFFKKIIESEK